MLSSIFVSYLPYALVTSFTPGPNNVLALHTVSQNGWAQGKNTLLGSSQVFSASWRCAPCSATSSTTSSPPSPRPCGTWGRDTPLAGRPRGPEQTRRGGEPKASFWKGFLLQFVNVKIILYAITIYTGYVFPAGGGSTMVPVQPFLPHPDRHRRVYDLGRGGRAVPGLPHQHTGPSIRHGGGAGPLRRGHGGLRGGGGAHRDFPKISPKPDGRGPPGPLQWRWKQHPPDLRQKGRHLTMEKTYVLDTSVLLQTPYA